MLALSSRSMTRPSRSEVRAAAISAMISSRVAASPAVAAARAARARLSGDDLIESGGLADRCSGERVAAHGAKADGAGHHLLTGPKLHSVVVDHQQRAGAAHRRAR